MDIINTLIRGLLSLVTLFFVTKLLGKKQVSQLSLFDYVIGISIGNFAAEVTTDLNVPIVIGVVAVLEFGIIAYILSILNMKSLKLRNFIIGKPSVIIQDGMILPKNMMKNRIDINTLLEEARMNRIFDISKVDYAVLETNGNLSFLLKGENLPVTIKEENLKAQKQSLCANIIIDGVILEKNLKKINKNKQWLEQKLNEKGKTLKNIILATIDNKEKIVIFEKNIKTEILDVLE